MRGIHPPILNLFRLQLRLITNSGPMSCCEGSVEKPSKRLSRLYCTPAINDDEVKDINSVVGIQIGLSYVSWAKIDTRRKFLSDLKLQTLPNDFQKMELHQIYSLAYATIRDLPPADCYVMENLPKIVSSSSGKLQLNLHASRMQLVAMLVALLNQNESGNKVRFIKQRVSSRLFNLLIGTERISSEGVVSKLLRNDDFRPFTKHECCSHAHSFYDSAQSVNKEILGQAVLLTVTFTELMLYKNQECYKLLLTDPKKKSS